MLPFPMSLKLFHLPSLLRIFNWSESDLASESNDLNMRFPVFNQLALASLATSAVATNLFVSSYAGTITSLELDRNPRNGGYSLTTIGSNNGSVPNPSWLELDRYNDVLYCVDEGLSVPNGSISAYKNSASGGLTLIDRHTTISGPVSTVVFNGGKAIVAAHYSGSAVTNWGVNSNGSLTHLQDFVFSLTAPGTNPDRQDAPHPHEAIVDPTDKYIIIPDLGADLLRVFTISPSTSLLTESTPFSTPAGSGPRHGVFLKSSCEKDTTYFFLTSELANTVTSYKVTYTAAGLGFKEVFTSSIYGPQGTRTGAAAAEVILSPDSKFLLTSSRNDSLFSIPSFAPSAQNNTLIPSDTLQSWSINHTDGTLSFQQLAAAGGRFPRQFSTNKNGTLVAVGLQSDGRVVILERNVETGKLGDFVASQDVTGEVTSVVFDEL